MAPKTKGKSKGVESCLMPWTAAVEHIKNSHGAA